MSAPWQYLSHGCLNRFLPRHRQSHFSSWGTEHCITGLSPITFCLFNCFCPTFHYFQMWGWNVPAFLGASFPMVSILYNISTFFLSTIMKVVTVYSCIFIVPRSLNMLICCFCTLLLALSIFCKSSWTKPRSFHKADRNLPCLVLACFFQPCFLMDLCAQGTSYHLPGDMWVSLFLVSSIACVFCFWLEYSFLYHFLSGPGLKAAWIIKPVFSW